MAQRRMSRKSFRKSRGRKTRSTCKRTIGGDINISSELKDSFRNTHINRTGQTCVGTINKMMGKSLDDAEKACELDKVKMYIVQDNEAKAREHLNVLEPGKTLEKYISEEQSALEQRKNDAERAKEDKQRKIEDSKLNKRNALRQVSEELTKFASIYFNAQTTTSEPSYASSLDASPEPAIKHLAQLFPEPISTNIANFIYDVKKGTSASAGEKARMYNRAHYILNKILEKNAQPTLSTVYETAGKDESGYYISALMLDMPSDLDNAYKNSGITDEDLVINLDEEFTFLKRGGRKTRRHRNKKSRKTRRR